MKQEIDFVKFSPTQNMTILVQTSSRVEAYPRIAAKMMSYDSVHAEQVGFIEKANRDEAAAYLHMAGGEFCGNACMSLAAFLASENGLSHNEETDIVLEASGTDRFVSCRVRRRADDYSCQVAMPVPETIERRSIGTDDGDWEMAMVSYPDFFHAVIEVDHFNEAVRKRAQALAKQLWATSEASLIGILLYKAASNELAPLIYVPALDSLIWERGCGSGTASLGAYLAWKNKRSIAAPVRQPGGTIHVAAHCHKEWVTSLKIEGTVEIVARGKAYIEL